MTLIRTGLQIRIKARERVRGDKDGFANDTFFTETAISADIFDTSKAKRTITEKIESAVLKDIPRKIKKIK